MKLAISLMLLFFSFGAFAQADITPSVSDALTHGDAAALSSFLMPQVEITLPNQDGNFSKEEAKKLLTDFFTKNPVTSFLIKHQGTSKLDDQYRIGELVTQKGNFRITFFMKKNASSMLIKQLKIEPAG